jgi:CelD/BcsL family acetyltransferase involved in cellulose biosynthesis
MTTRTTRTVALADVSADDAARWADLAARAAEPNPFLDPAFLLAAHRWFPDTGDIRLVVVEEGEQMLALLPLSVAPRFAGLPLPFSTTAGPFLARRAPLCAPLVDRETATDTLTTLLGHLGRRDAGFPGLVELTLFPGDGALHDAIHEAARATGTPVLERYRFERAAVRPVPPPATWRDELSPGRRRKLRRFTRALEDELGHPLVGDEVGDDPQALEEFFDLEAAGWKGTTPGGGALRVTPHGVEWFTDVADGFRDRGLLRVFALRAGDVTLYMSVKLVCGGGVFGVMDTYDERFARWSPGVVGRAAEVDQVLADPRHVDVFDQCMHPKNVESSALYPQRRALVGLLLAPRGATNRALVRGIPRLRAARASLRTVRDSSRDAPGTRTSTPEAA